MRGSRMLDVSPKVSGMSSGPRVQFDPVLSRRPQTGKEGKEIHCVSILKLETESELLSNDLVLWEENPQIHREIQLVRQLSKMLDIQSICKNQLSFFVQKKQQWGKNQFTETTATK